ncbi:putative oxidoreductase, aryl-alcohol dehydrogenase like protein [Saccharomonospora marina XMU15]|uniref:Putative oxidoreductase, aryl-alcohol dehydrogenase like protein n=1 Tax=Saccharomonospora marina XMU15 TaxID=882083 RepID=H5X2I1_9PSEU|nr:aldo/keto reductase [Saccharomonospora marina]EHR49846.1 putative oxidoreductase, aryl-alcohol dehydrogenase like protein [Saccharomonospora marina XMU15]
MLDLGRFSLGTAGLGNLYEPMSDEQAWAVLDAAWECGVRYFDTAPHYGLGLAERRLGAFLATKRRSEFVVSTKVGRLLVPDPAGADRLDLANHYAVPADARRVWDFTSGGVRRCLEESLLRLGMESVDVLYLHDPDEYELAPALEQGLPALAALREEGVVSAIGVGSKSTDALVRAVRYELLDLVLVAGRFTLLEQPALEELIPRCRDHGVAIVNAGVFNSGLLAATWPSADDRYEYGPVPADVLAKARAIAEVCAEHGTDLPTAALAFSLREPLVRTVLTGAAAPDHVRANQRRLATPVPEELWTVLRDKGLTRL